MNSVLTVVATTSAWLLEIHVSEIRCSGDTSNQLKSSSKVRAGSGLMWGLLAYEMQRMLTFCGIVVGEKKESDQ